MTLTMPRRWGPIPGGDRRQECASCGLTYYRSTMWRGEDGLIRCSEAGCADGRVARTLDRINSQAAARPPRQARRSDW